MITLTLNVCRANIPIESWMVEEDGVGYPMITLRAFSLRIRVEMSKVTITYMMLKLRPHDRPNFAPYRDEFL
ncbi:hypothetical protein TNCV_3501311 [Trichonephila clavipes]|uniref:Uncharacterized protein n=1 Tax=Trichonephila clavipes TaxID=2585209 RepID=A0A8X6RZW3_TRICX|nr:hypothetical protein TNCV_3501311 [Trichonephila clavipes]